MKMKVCAHRYRHVEQKYALSSSH